MAVSSSCQVFIVHECSFGVTAKFFLSKVFFMRKYVCISLVSLTPKTKTREFEQRGSRSLLSIWRRKPSSLIAFRHPQKLCSHYLAHTLNFKCETEDRSKRCTRRRGLEWRWEVDPRTTIERVKLLLSGWLDERDRNDPNCIFCRHRKSVSTSISWHCGTRLTSTPTITTNQPTNQPI